MIEYNDGSGWKKSEHKRWSQAMAEADALATNKDCFMPHKPKYVSYRERVGDVVLREYIGTNHDLPKSE